MFKKIPLILKATPFVLAGVLFLISLGGFGYCGYLSWKTGPRVLNEEIDVSVQRQYNFELQSLNDTMRLSSHLLFPELGHHRRERIKKTNQFGKEYYRNLPWPDEIQELKKTISQGLLINLVLKNASDQVVLNTTLPQDISFRSGKESFLSPNVGAFRLFFKDFNQLVDRRSSMYQLTLEVKRPLKLNSTPKARLRVGLGGALHKDAAVEGGICFLAASFVAAISLLLMCIGIVLRLLKGKK